MKWVSVTERLPEQDVDVLLYRKLSASETAKLNKHGIGPYELGRRCLSLWHMQFRSETACKGKITHWCAITEPEADK